MSSSIPRFLPPFLPHAAKRSRKAHDDDVSIRDPQKSNLNEHTQEEINMKMKKLLALVLALVMVMSLLPMSALAAPEGAGGRGP